MQNFHIILGKYIGPSNKKPARISIYSPRFKQRVIVSREHYESPVDWLTKHGFNVVGSGLTDTHVVIVSTTFNGLK